jgi:hypothetical protein
MFNNYQFNTRKYNHAETWVFAPVGVTAISGSAPNFVYVHIIVDAVTGTMTVSAYAPLVITPLALAIPVGTITVNSNQSDLVQILAHYIYQCSYKSLPRNINRVYVVGQNENDLMVYGEDSDATINGEVLEYVTDSMITTEADALTVADNILSKLRFTDRGFILIGTNCGVELYDVPYITDTVNNQAGKYRVRGWDFLYDNGMIGGGEAKYEHRLQLTTV